MKKNRVLVTGANGFIASKLIDELVKAGEHIVVGTSRKNRKSVQTFPFVEIDLSEDFVLDDQFDTVVHCAGQTGLSANKSIFERNNFLATKNMVDWAKKSGVKKFIFVSTPSIYMSSTDQTSIKEGDVPSQIMTSYGDSKLRCESYLEKHSDSFDSVHIVRPATVYGVGNHNLKNAINKIRKSRKVLCFGSEFPKLSMTSLDNLVDGLITLVDSEKKGFGIYNFSDEEPVELANFFLRDYYKSNKIDFQTIKLPFAPFYFFSKGVQAIYKALNIVAEPFLSPYIVINLGKTRILDTSKFKESFGFKQKRNTLQELQIFNEWISQ